MYKIIGADGRQYGPISVEQVRQWIIEGRVDSRTPVFTNGAKDWTFLGLLPEFVNYFVATTSPPAAMPSQARKTNSFATAGLVCGILSWICCCGFPINLMGLVFSLVALLQINRHPEVHEGRGVAIAGLALSLANLLLGLGMLVWSLAFNPPMIHWHTGGL
jgi:hypothetical protein